VWCEPCEDGDTGGANVISNLLAGGVGAEASYCLDLGCRRCEVTSSKILLSSQHLVRMSTAFPGLLSTSWVTNERIP
jgi:hypothetical protein